MTLEERINKDYIAAMKARDSVRSTALSFLRAQIKQVLVDKRLEKLEDSETLAIIKKQVKQRLDSIDQFGKGNRQDLVAKETVELEILKAYIPVEMALDEVKALVDAAIKELGVVSMKDMGLVMKAARDKVAGRADGKLVSELVKERLAAL
ncbi:MAG: GatB/YqeY domain-containing protein [Candidatus Omnitrophica bacterium]|nr:GatB/YqeY domain-containing protein [Candidatus Omnitrophota bacterium]